MDLDVPISQERFASLVGVSAPTVTELMRKGVLEPGAPASRWLLQYTARLREEAAGRSTELTEQRARYDRARADYQEMVNAEKRRYLVPLPLLEKILAQVGRRVTGILEAASVRIAREVGHVDPRVRAVVDEELVRARNEAALLELSLDEIDGSLRDQAGDPQGDDGLEGAVAAATVSMG